MIVTAPRQARALAPDAIHQVAEHPDLRTAPTLHDALQMVRDATPEDVVFITGSLYLVGQLRHYWKQRAQVAAG